MGRVLAGFASLGLGIALLGCGTGQEETGEPAPEPQLNEPTTEPPTLDDDEKETDPASDAPE